ncbi:MAG: Lysine--tRNA ligase [Candidatus Lokiarchaeum sp. GC14_75]|nr:MAG: Lysine--tRNA ligase [Candidatus Lokiarchaeum sp. GC14_75]
MNKDFPAHWLEEIVDKIIERKESIITLATGKTPSGYIHLGILREIIICDSLRRIFEKKDKYVKFFLFLDSLDAAKRFPEYIEKSFQLKHLGKPFSHIPCPFQDCQCESYAHHFGNNFSSTFKDFGIKTEIVWTHELYKKKEMQEKIKIALERNEEIKEIIRNHIIPTLNEEKKAQFLKMQEYWKPVMVICEKCDKIQNREKDETIKPNRVVEYFHEKNQVSYYCNACGHTGNISIYSGRLKLNWRVDWPAKWAIYKTTCEPAGKDHSVKGGAYDTGIELCQKLFNYRGPVKVPYEWLRLGDRDMKTSKGIVFTPKKFLEIADPKILKTIILRTNPIKHIAFRVEEIPQYYDFYEKAEDIYFSKPLGDGSEDFLNLRYLYPLFQIDDVPKEKPPKIPFKLLIFFSQIQNIISIEKLYEKASHESHLENFQTIISKKIFKTLIKRTSNWLNLVKEIIRNENDNKIKSEIIRKINIFTIPKKIESDVLESLDDNQKKGISILGRFLNKNESLNPDLVQNKIFNIAKIELEIQPRKLFEAVYKIILGKRSGPRLGTFLSLLDKQWLLKRLEI